MDGFNFMTFSVEDSVNCIEYFREGQMFVATPNSIKVYDMVKSQLIAESSHSLGNKCNQKPQRQGQQEQVLSPLQMHFFPGAPYHIQQQSKPQQKDKLSRVYNLSFGEFEDSSQSEASVLGYLLVHYKLRGLATYKVRELESGQIVIEAPPVSFLEVKFGSAFLNLCLLGNSYRQANTIANKLIREKLISNQNQLNSTNRSIQAYLDNSSKLTDFILHPQTTKTREFMIFSNQKQMFEIKKVQIDQKGHLKVKQSYQIDEETGNLTQATVTAMRYFEYLNEGGTRKEQFLIMAMEGGNLLLYQLPQKDKHQNNLEHYLEPIKSIKIKNFLQFQPNKEDLDFSIMKIQLVHQSYALLLVRNCGILLMDLKEFTIVKHICLESNAVEGKKYYFSDIRLMTLIEQQVNFSNEAEQMESPKLSSSRVEIRLVLANKNSLKKLILSFGVNKYIQDSQHKETDRPKVVQKIQNVKVKCNLIQQLNTALINHIFTVSNLSPSSTEQQIQVLGNFQTNKIFSFTL